jgi:hypothetical protein
MKGERYKWNIVESGFKHHNLNPNFYFMSHFNRYKFNIGQYMKMDKKIIKKPDLNEQKYCKMSLYFMLMKNLMLDKLDPEGNG